MNHQTFADTSFFIALVDVDDESHKAAERLADRLQGELVTTTGVLLELGAFFSAPPTRRAFAELNRLIRAGDGIVLIPLDEALQDEGTSLFLARPDKGWSLMDCTSFVLMNQRSIHKALTTDHHFKQAGFETPMLAEMRE